MIKLKTKELHFDESSPHLHIVGVAFKDGMKNGIEKQVGKSDVFNKIRLKEIQDKMRVYCINSFNGIYHLNYTLKEKVSALKETLNYFKELWNKFIRFLQDKFFFNYKYDDFINDLYEEDILDENDIDIIQNN